MISDSIIGNKGIMPFYDIHSFIKTQGPLVTTNFYKVTVVVGVVFWDIFLAYGL